MEWEMLRNYDKTIEKEKEFLSKVGPQIKYGYHTPEYFFGGPGLGPDFIPVCRGNEIFERKRLLLRARAPHYIYKTVFDKIIELSTPELIYISRMRQNTSSEQIKHKPLPNHDYTIVELRRIMKSAGLHIKSGVKKVYLYDELSKALSKELSALS